MIDRRQACLATLAAAASAERVLAGAAQPEETEMAKQFEAFEIEGLEQARAESGKSYLTFLERSTLSTGLYVLTKGATDHQQPHDRDEVYYILGGRARFVSDGAEREEVEVKEGSVLFVAAGVSHRFFDIEEDLSVLVFFAAKPGGSD